MNQKTSLNHKASFLPTSRKELDTLGFQNVDIILFTGDAYVDHPSFGPAVIGRVLEHEGYRVAIVPQPNWRDDLRDFTKLGKPKLFFGVSAGNMDSMVNRYTAAKRLRSDDAYTPEGRAGMRPDYTVTVYTRILKKIFPDVPVVIGGIEASLRRLTHYDYWSDTLKPSVLVDSGADFLVYGMGERPMVALAAKMRQRTSLADLRTVPQIAYVCRDSEIPSATEGPGSPAIPAGPESSANHAGPGSPATPTDLGSFSASDSTPASALLRLPSHAQCVAHKPLFATHFQQIEKAANQAQPPVLVEPQDQGRSVVVNPPYPLMTQAQLDAVYDLPFTYQAHFRYKGKRIPALEMIQFSVCLHRGCFGGCSFCTIAAHQGRAIASRSQGSVLREIDRLSQLDGFKGYLTDLGGPSANMYQMQGRDLALCRRCHRTSCLFPNKCKNLNDSHQPLLDLYAAVRNLPYIKKATIGSGIRYDLFLNKEGFLNAEGERYFNTLLEHHVSGRLKVAPEHTEDHVLACMHKPPFALYKTLSAQFEARTRRMGLKLQIVPYFISSHPACTMHDMEQLSRTFAQQHLHVEQVQDFTPTPMTKSSVMFYSGLDPDTLKPVFVERNPAKKQRQKSLFGI